MMAFSVGEVVCMVKGELDFQSLNVLLIICFVQTIYISSSQPGVISIPAGKVTMLGDSFGGHPGKE
jgi:hypothetical protein